MTSYHYLEFLASGEWQEKGGDFVDRFLKFTISTNLFSKRARKLLDFKTNFLKNNTFFILLM